MSKYYADRFWHVVLEVVYVTNYADPPAYARLPTYFTDEIAALRR
jgi:hypothetical protein